MFTAKRLVLRTDLVLSWTNIFLLHMQITLGHISFSSTQPSFTFLSCSSVKQQVFPCFHIHTCKYEMNVTEVLLLQLQLLFHYYCLSKCKVQFKTISCWNHYLCSIEKLCTNCITYLRCCPIMIISSL